MNLIDRCLQKKETEEAPKEKSIAWTAEKLLFGIRFAAYTQNKKRKIRQSAQKISGTFKRSADFFYLHEIMLTMQEEKTILS